LRATRTTPPRASSARSSAARSAAAGIRAGRGEFRFDDLRREAARAAGARRTRRGPDRRYRLEIDFVTAALGGKKRLDLGDGRALEVAIPAGAEHGSVLRLKAQGETGTPPGDALVDAIGPTRCSRKGDDIQVELAISVPALRGEIPCRRSRSGAHQCRRAATAGARCGSRAGASPGRMAGAATSTCACS
jgi:DnaJ-class molecular chaperone